MALKVLTGLGPGAEALLERFRREAEVASRLDHPALCAVYETGVDGDAAYIAMRYVDGDTLATRIRNARDPSGATSRCVDLDEPTSRERYTLNEPVALTAGAISGTEDIMQSVCLIEHVARALHAAHEAGVLHRDIKPGKIMVKPEGDPVVLNVGLAREMEVDSPPLTRTGELFGTPHYMSPEQITRHSVRLDRRTDVYSLGVTLYECLTLVRPFEAPTREALYQAILAKTPLDPRRLNPRIPKDLKIVLDTALE